jgi:hypothetical protein
MNSEIEYTLFHYQAAALPKRTIWDVKYFKPM